MGRRWTSLEGVDSARWRQRTVAQPLTLRSGTGNTRTPSRTTKIRGLMARLFQAHVVQWHPGVALSVSRLVQAAQARE